MFYKIQKLEVGAANEELHVQKKFLGQFGPLDVSRTFT